MKHLKIYSIFLLVILTGCASSFRETAMKTLGIDCESPKDCYNKMQFKQPGDPEFVILMAPMSLLNLRIGKELEANLGDKALITYDLTYQTNKEVVRFDIPISGNQTTKVEKNVLYIEAPWGKTVRNLDTGATYQSYKGVLTLRDKRKVIEVEAEEDSYEKAFTTASMKAAAQIVKNLRTAGI